VYGDTDYSFGGYVTTTNGAGETEYVRRTAVIPAGGQPVTFEIITLCGIWNSDLRNSLVLQ
jgi:hypothetical protein